MKCNKYKLKDQTEFLAYIKDGEEFIFPEFLGIELVEEDIDPSKKGYYELQIIHAPEIFTKNSRDKKLEREGIQSYFDLCNATFLIKSKSLSKSRSIRELVLEKFNDVLDFVKLDKKDAENVES